jgi:NhaA family Na+:H+ antiporter
VQEFLRSSTSGALAMLVAVLVALVWANSPWWRGYEQLWLTPMVLRFGRWAIVEDVRFWIDEGLMTFFFLLAGMEIKRELAIGELRDTRSIVGPALGAIGGMLVPALLFLAITRGTAASEGWGMAMPTDLAFALAILVLASRALPPGLRPFLLTLAIIDDLLTVALVAVFYAGDLSGPWLLIALLLIAAMVGCERAHVRHLLPYVVLGVLTWLCVYAGGVHPALVGAVLGLLVPARPFDRSTGTSAQAVSPLARAEHVLLPWVNLLVLPLFALANAGVRLSGGWWTGSTERFLIVGLVAARVFGKVAGIVGAGLIAKRWRLARMPDGIGLGALAGVAVAAGAPFTVSLFVASGTFPEGSTLLAAARIGVLVSLVACGICAAVIFRVHPSRDQG